MLVLMYSTNTMTVAPRAVPEKIRPKLQDDVAAAFWLHCTTMRLDMGDAATYAIEQWLLTEGVKVIKTKGKSTRK